MISKLLYLFNNENPSYKGKRKTQSFLKEQRAHRKCTFPKSNHTNYQYANAHVHVFVFTFLILMPKKKAFCTTLNLLLNDQYKQVHFFEIREDRRDYNT